MIFGSPACRRRLSVRKAGQSAGTGRPTEGHLMSDAVSTEDVLDYLTDVDYPADKDALAPAAQRAAAAPGAVLPSIRKIPPAVPSAKCVT
jgi:hypothetical protein